MFFAFSLVSGAGYWERRRPAGLFCQFVFAKGMMMDGLSMFVMLIAGAVGTGLLIYGIRQKEPAPLAFGVAISIVPFMMPGWLAAVVSVGLIVLFMAIRKRL